MQSATSSCNLEDLQKQSLKQKKRSFLVVQAEKQERREEEIHLAELTATARNDEEVIAKLHKVSSHFYTHLSKL